MGGTGVTELGTLGGSRATGRAHLRAVPPWGKERTPQAPRSPPSAAATPGPQGEQGAPAGSQETPGPRSGRITATRQGPGLRFPAPVGPPVHQLGSPHLGSRKSPRENLSRRGSSPPGLLCGQRCLLGPAAPPRLSVHVCEQHAPSLSFLPHGSRTGLPPQQAREPQAPFPGLGEPSPCRLCPREPSLFRQACPDPTRAAWTPKAGPKPSSPDPSKVAKRQPRPGTAQGGGRGGARSSHSFGDARACTTTVTRGRGNPDPRLVYTGARPPPQLVLGPETPTARPGTPLSPQPAVLPRSWVLLAVPITGCGVGPGKSSSGLGLGDGGPLSGLVSGEPKTQHPDHSQAPHRLGVGVCTQALTAPPYEGRDEGSRDELEAAGEGCRGAGVGGHPAERGEPYGAGGGLRPLNVARRQPQKQGGEDRATRRGSQLLRRGRGRKEAAARPGQGAEPGWLEPHSSWMRGSQARCPPQDHPALALPRPCLWGGHSTRQGLQPRLPDAHICPPSPCKYPSRSTSCTPQGSAPPELHDGCKPRVSGPLGEQGCLRVWGPQKQLTRPRKGEQPLPPRFSLHTSPPGRRGQSEHRRAESRWPGPGLAARPGAGEGHWWGGEGWAAPRQAPGLLPPQPGMILPRWAHSPSPATSRAPHLPTPSGSQELELGPGGGPPALGPEPRLVPRARAPPGQGAEVPARASAPGVGARHTGKSRVPRKLGQRGHRCCQRVGSSPLPSRQLCTPRDQSSPPTGHALSSHKKPTRQSRNGGEPALRPSVPDAKAPQKGTACPILLPCAGGSGGARGTRGSPPHSSRASLPPRPPLPTRAENILRVNGDPREDQLEEAAQPPE
ncbi:collagen alpha-1(III) chain-like [Choloepus didactylus]|uniref:collagen alpha-1(III) chain-like n=1 Tax=Choloepus didactylus TaxID=27675 RepID=UPI00189EB58E|nr:collagen alpha-1(III) chain-like [Choloepus didactylus]